jgi:hypothetical protein
LFLVPMMERRWRFVAGGVAGSLALLVASTALVGIDLQRSYWFEYLPHIARTTRLPPGVPDFGFAPGGYARDPEAETWTWDGRRYTKPEPMPGSLGSATHAITLMVGHGASEGWTAFSSTASGFVLLLSLGLLWIRGRSGADPAAVRAWRWSTMMLTLMAWHPHSWVMTYVWLLFVLPLLWYHRHAIALGRTARSVAAFGLVLSMLGPPVAMGASQLLPPRSGTWGFFVRFLIFRRVVLGGLLLWAVAVTRRPRRVKTPVARGT